MSELAAAARDWSDWEAYRDQVVHPAGTIKAVDLDRAHENIRWHDWAKRYADSLQASAEGIVDTVTPAWLKTLIEPTTPGAMGPCPACRAKGLPWHPNGQWSWSADAPDNLTCIICETVFPTDEHPEEVVVRSTWGKGQTLTFMGGDTFKCFSYLKARPSISGITRARKVDHATGQLQKLATAHALTQDPRYARAAKAILLRFAEVFPEYLVRAGYGYGEYAGMDPHIAAEHILDLPEDELVYPPNKPDRKIHTGYWSASRIGTSGMDGGWVVRISDAYSLTCTALEDGEPVYTPEERALIERDVLLEGTYLAACDTLLNNKSVGNLAGAAVAGLCVGHPGLVHFGVDGFVKAVSDWFLPDGTTSESPAYAMMTMSGIRPFALALREYSDPEGFTGADGTHYDDLNACRDTLYGDCWQGLIWTLQGDLNFWPSADSYRSTTISVPFADLIALGYPTDSHIGLLKELIDRDPQEQGGQAAVFYREPDLAERTAPPFELPETVFPYLSHGHLRTGAGGRDSLAVLNGSDFGVHHHIDGLNLYYWKDGHELLSDLGYLWDHQDKYQTARTAAHNLVMIDGKDQTARGRKGSIELFSVTPSVKVMEASSDAYGPDVTYLRTVVQIDHVPGGSYLLDIFRASGGQTADHIVHGPTGANEPCDVHGLDLLPAEPFDFGENGPELSDLRQASGGNPWRVAFVYDDGYTFTAFAPAAEAETVLVGNGWGQRDHRNSDVGASLPYIIRRVEGQDRPGAFVTVFEGSSQGQSLVKAVSIIDLPSGAPDATVAVAVRTSLGTDIVISSIREGLVTIETDIGEVATDGALAAVLTTDSGPSAACLLAGTRLSAPGVDLTSSKDLLSGSIVGRGSDRGRSWFDIDASLSDLESLICQTIFTIEGSARHGYQVRGVEDTDAGCRVFTKLDGQGFEARPADRWDLPVTVYG